MKRAVIGYLAKTKDPTTSVVIDKQHPEFKDMYNTIYRGVTFALVSLTIRSLEIPDAWTSVTKCGSAQLIWTLY